MKKGLLFLFFALLCGAATTQAQTTRYVAPTATGLGDGSSWANASGDLQTMINASAGGDEVWVKAGTYLPTQDPFGATSPADPRDKTFYVKDGVKLYGGFAGTETALSQRLIATNITILSGDIGTAGDAIDNAYHVVLASAATSGGVGVTVDGFSIAGGNANDITYANITVNGNIIGRSSGGGIYTVNGTNTLSNNTLSGNTTIFYGGGIYTVNGTNTITNNTLSGNTATNYGGGIYTAYGTNTLHNNTLSSNTANYGGGIYTAYGTNTLHNNTLSGNTASNSGGGIYSYYDTNNTLSNNTLSGNTAIYFGGGICTESGNNTLHNNTLSGNTASYGGGIHTAYGTNTLSNNTLSGNLATNYGGGISTYFGTNTITNTIFWGNQQFGSPTIAGADYYNDGSTVTFTNNLMQLAAGNYTVGNLNDLGTASGNIFATDPLFVNAADIDGADNIHRTADDGLRLQVGSPAINVGDNAGVAATDITGAARIQDTTVDMGAYEGGVFVCPSVVTLYVDASVAASGNGQSWATAYQTLDEALAIAHCCSIIDTIKVAANTYIPTKKPYDGCTEMTTADARDLTFHLPDGIVLWGGYPAGGGVRNSVANITTLSGDFSGDDVVTGTGATLSITNNTENAYHVLLASGSTGVTVDGFAITGGNANSSTFLLVNGNNISQDNGGGITLFSGTNNLSNNTLSGNSATNGGGIYTSQGTNTLANNTLSGNSATNSGGGILTLDGTNSITNNTLSGNSATNSGGSIYIAQGINTLTNNTISGNSSDNYGGGISTYYGTNTLANNTISGNSAANGGGGISILGGTNDITNNVISDNSADNYGGGISTYYGTNTLTNNTISGNSATNYGGGLYTSNGTNTLSNNIFWGNEKGTSTTVQDADYYATGTNGNTFTNNLLQLAASNYPTDASLNYGIGTAATGNLFAQDPLFVNAADIDGADNIHRTADDGLQLQPSSPCINTGNNTGVAATDITGADRIQDTTVDMGAYEGMPVICGARRGTWGN